MLKDRIIQQLNDQLGQLLSGLTGDGTQDRNELQNSVRAVVQNVVEKLDLVTRDEFDAQCELLEKAQQQLAQLEDELARLNQTPAE